MVHSQKSGSKDMEMEKLESYQSPQHATPNETVSFGSPERRSRGRNLHVFCTSFPQSPTLTGPWPQTPCLTPTPSHAINPPPRGNSGHIHPIGTPILLCHASNPSFSCLSSILRRLEWETWLWRADLWPPSRARHPPRLTGDPWKCSIRLPSEELRHRKAITDALM